SSGPTREPPPSAAQVPRRMPSLFLSFSLGNPDDQLSQAYVVVLVVNAKRDHVFTRREHVGLPGKGLILRICDAVARKHSPELSSIHRNLRLIKSRRQVCRLDSNPNPSPVQSILLQGHRWRRIVDRKGPAFHLG